MQFIPERRYTSSPERLVKGGYISIKTLSENLYRNPVQQCLTRSKYRNISEIATKRGRSWQKRLGYISDAIDSLGNAGKTGQKHLEATRDVLVDYRNHGYLRRSIREGFTREEDFNNVITKLDRYIGSQNSRRRNLRNSALKTAAAAGIAIGYLFSKGHTAKKYDADMAALNLLNTRPAIAQTYTPAVPDADTEILNEVERAVSDVVEGRKHTDPVAANILETGMDKPTESQLPAGSDYRQKTDVEKPEGAKAVVAGVKDVNEPGIGNLSERDDYSLDLRRIAEQFLEEDAGIGAIPATLNQDLAQEMSDQFEYADSDSGGAYTDHGKTRQVVIPGGNAQAGGKENVRTYTVVLDADPSEIQVKIPDESDLYSWKNRVRDIFGPEMKLKPIKADCSEAELLMRIAAEAYMTNRDYTAHQLYKKAKSLDPAVHGVVADTNSDGSIDGKDSSLLALIEGNIGISRFYLNEARSKLESGDKVGAYVLTHNALMYNGEAMTEVEEIRKKCNMLDAVLGDMAAYGNWLCYDGDIPYKGRKIKPHDIGIYPTRFPESLEFTGKHGGKLLNDTGKTLHKSFNTVVAMGDGLVSTALNGTEGILGNIGKIIGLNKGVDYDKRFKDKMRVVDERTKSGYGSGKTYTGKPGGEFLLDLWKVGNDAVNTGGGGLMVAYNGTIRPVVEAAGIVAGGEDGYKGAHEVAGLGQIPICFVTDMFPVFGNDEPKKVQSNSFAEFAERIHFSYPTRTDFGDVNRDGNYTLGEFIATFPGVQAFAKPEDPYSSMTQRILRWVSNIYEVHIIFRDHDGKKARVCTQPERTGGGPVKEIVPGRAGGSPGR